MVLLGGKSYEKTLVDHRILLRLDRGNPAGRGAVSDKLLCYRTAHHSPLGFALSPSSGNYCVDLMGDGRRRSVGGSAGRRRGNLSGDAILVYAEIRSVSILGRHVRF